MICCSEFFLEYITIAPNGPIQYIDWVPKIVPHGAQNVDSPLGCYIIVFGKCQAYNVGQGDRLREIGLALE